MKTTNAEEKLALSLLLYEIVEEIKLSLDYPRFNTYKSIASFLQTDESTLSKARRLHETGNKKQPTNIASLEFLIDSITSLIQNFNLSNELVARIPKSILENSRKYTEDISYFIYYYIDRHMKEVTALLEVYNNKKIVLKMFDKNSSASEFIIKYFYTGEINSTLFENKFCILIDGRNYGGEPRTESSMSWFNGDFNNKDINIFYGTFVAGASSSCGLIAIHRTTINNWKSMLKGDIDSTIKIPLVNSRFSALDYIKDIENPYVSDKIKLLAETASKISGKYFAYIIKNGLAAGLGELLCIPFEFKVDGTIIFNSHTDNKIEFGNIIDITTSGIIVFNFEYDAIYKYSKMQLSLTYNNESKYLSGTFSSIEVSGFPSAGRIILLRQDGNSVFKLDQHKTLSISKKWNYENIYLTAENAELIRSFFIGDLDNFMAHNSIMDKINFSDHKNDIEELSNKDGIILLSSKIKFAEQIKNTRIIPSAKTPYFPEEANVWLKAIEESLAQGLVMKDIVSGFWKDEAEKLAANKKYLYKYKEVNLDSSLVSMLNFIVLYYKSGEKEVFFGWTISPSGKLDGKCLRTTNPYIVNLFDSWFDQLH